jgi:hypothetical protein
MLTINKWNKFISTSNKSNFLLTLFNQQRDEINSMFMKVDYKWKLEEKHVHRNRYCKPYDNLLQKFIKNKNNFKT